MAYTRHTLSTAFRHLPRCVHSSLPHVLSRDDFTESPPVSPFPSQFYTSHSHSPGSGFYLPLGLQMASLRSYSSPPTDGSSEDEYMKDITNVLTDGIPEDAVSVAPSAVPASFHGEVTAAAVDCLFPVAAFEHLIEQVHTFTGLNWWAAIALTTILYKTATIPLHIALTKEVSKRRKLMAEHKKLVQEMQNCTDPQIKQESQKKMRALPNKYGIIPYAHLYGICISCFISFSFYFAISNMVEKVPSFKEGGILWFTDLTTPDQTYILPVIHSLAYLFNVEFGNPNYPMPKGLKNLYRVIALLLVPFTATLPKAYLFWWISSILVRIVYRTVKFFVLTLEWTTTNLVFYV